MRLTSFCISHPVERGNRFNRYYILGITAHAEIKTDMTH